MSNFLERTNAQASRSGFVSRRILDGIPEEQIAVEFASKFPATDLSGCTFNDSLINARKFLGEVGVSYESIQSGLKEYALLRKIQNLTHARMRSIEGDHLRVSLPTPTELTGATRTKSSRDAKQQPTPTGALAACLIAQHSYDLVMLFRLTRDVTGGGEALNSSPLVGS